MWFNWIGSGIRHRYRWGFSTSRDQTFCLFLFSMVHVVRPCLRSRIQGIRGHGSDPHFRRGTGVIRVRTY